MIHFSCLDKCTLNQNKFKKMEPLKYGFRVFNTASTKSSYITVDGNGASKQEQLLNNVITVEPV